MFSSMLFNAIELYYVALFFAVIVSGLIFWLDRPWLILAIHVSLTAWILFSESRALVEDKDAVFMFGVASRIIVCNVALLAIGQVLRICLRRVKSATINGTDGNHSAL